MYHIARHEMKQSGEEPPPNKRQKRGNGPQLNAFFKSYKGLDDFHLPIFRALLCFYNLNHHSSSNIKVLYPGCHRHITASLVFSCVTYVDSDPKVCGLYNDERALAWVNENKDYQEESDITVKNANFMQTVDGLGNDSFDILVSASAGIVSEPCARYLKPGGYLLVSDAHYDARMAFTNKEEFQLVAFWDETWEIFDVDVRDFFCAVKKGRGKQKGGALPITREQVQQSIDLPKAKRSFKLLKEGMFFIFEKVGAER